MDILSLVNSNNKTFINYNKKIIICGTHNNRLVCFLKNFKNISNNFKNCAIIKCYNNKIEMIYEGHLKKNNVNHWTIDIFNKEFIDIDINIPNNVEIYLIRHGNGTHNNLNIYEKIFNSTIDPSLDSDGVIQAIQAGIFLKDYLKNSYENITFTASELIRTQQTIGLIMQQMDINNNITIIPCNHELLYHINGGCNETIDKMIKIKSNIPMCKINNINESCYILTKFCNELNNCNINLKININWNYYINFYERMNKDNMKCNTNLISILLNSIDDRYN
jgi:bisphosphoglycerate-dependent phosphoglycerate mutase